MTAKMDPAQAQSINSVDPVCGRRVTSKDSSLRVTEYKKRKYYFCSEGCQHAFHNQTERFRLQELARAGALFQTTGVRWGLA